MTPKIPEYVVRLCSLALAVIFFQLIVGERHSQKENEEERYVERGHADEAFEWWYSQRALPFSTIPHDGFAKAFFYTKYVLSRTAQMRKSVIDSSRWESIGPNNIGGRVLSVAIDPESTNTIWAGSASGGLWRSTTGGVGAAAWKFVQTQFPLLSVSTIAINPASPNEMYVGTGEISGYNLGQVGTPGARTTYGLGILKSTDRGATWDTTGLTWQFSQARSVQKIVVNPRKPGTLYAATSEGTYKTVDAGKTWLPVHSVLMTMDVAINPVDTGVVYVACGQRNTAPNSGLYKTTNGGGTWMLLGGGLPSTNFGRTSLSISPVNPSVVYASVANAVTHNLDGLYRTADGGATWSNMSALNYLNGQGWYDNVVAAHPIDTNVVLCAGLDIYKSVDRGTTLAQKSYWYKDFSGVVPAGGPEGPPDYAHADHHAITFDPKKPMRIFFGTDGGVFESTDGGETFSGRNGGFITTQFYNGFANSATDSLLALGGLQDNGTLKYQGTVSWNKVYGGDGGWCAIDPTNRDILFEEYVYLAISRSTDGGTNWQVVCSSRSDSSNFIAPFVMAPSNGSILYAGTKKILKSTNAGVGWPATNSDSVLNGTNISCIGISHTSPDTVIAATGQRAIGTFVPKFEVFYTTNGGNKWSKSTASLPNRYPTDISFDPTNSAAAYLTFSGYGTSHVFKTTDAGKTWIDISSNLPDVPTQSVSIDPAFPLSIYVGTDLGVFRTTDGGTFWSEWNDGMPTAMVIDVGISPLDRRIRAATFGNGVFQRKLPAKGTNLVAGGEGFPEKFALEQNYPNPFNPRTAIGYQLSAVSFVLLTVYDVLGREVAVLVNERKEAGRYTIHWDASGFAGGIYFYTLQVGDFAETRKMLLLK